MRYQHDRDLGAYISHYLAEIEAPHSISVGGMQEAGLERRFQANESASVFSFRSEPMSVKILDVSANGLRMMVPQIVPCGADIQVVPSMASSMEK